MTVFRLEAGVDPTLFDRPEIEPNYWENELIDYVTVFADDENLGAFIIVKNTKTDYDLHYAIKNTRSAKMHIRSISKLILDYIFETYQCSRLTGWVKKKSIVNLSLKMGWVIEGKKRSVDFGGDSVIMIGITRDDWCKL